MRPGEDVLEPLIMMVIAVAMVMVCVMIVMLASMMMCARYYPAPQCHRSCKCRSWRYECPL